MPVSTRRGPLRGAAHSPPIRRAVRQAVNITASPAVDPSVTTVPTVIQPNENSNSTVSHTNNTFKDPKISRFTGSGDALRVEPFINIFERYFSALDDNSKVLKLGEYLAGDALNYFGTDIIVDLNITWIQAKQKLISHYAHSDIAPMVAGTRRKLLKQESIYSYFDDKFR